MKKSKSIDKAREITGLTILGLIASGYKSDQIVTGVLSVVVELVYISNKKDRDRTLEVINGLSLSTFDMLNNIDKISASRKRARDEKRGRTTASKKRHDIQKTS